jgi:hypothetical protein
MDQQYWSKYRLIFLTLDSIFCKLSIIFHCFKYHLNSIPLNMKKKIGCLLIIACWSTLCFTQQAVSTAGGDASGTGGTLSYSVGQVAYITNTENDGTITQGVQQPYEIMVISSIEDKYVISLELSVYPNPVSDYLILKAKDNTSFNLTYRLFDTNGKLLENKKLDGPETNILMDKLAPSIYYLKVSDNDKEVKTFKIIKY